MEEQQNLRESFWNVLKRGESSSSWDLIIVGGGITGAGIFLEAVRLGLKALLLEKSDFANGTSSRTSKLVHGGLRYLKEGQVFVTRHSVKERQRLLRESQDLVSSLNFLLPIYQKANPGRFLFEAALGLYDIIAGHWDHRYIKGSKFSSLVPNLNHESLNGGFLYKDAQVDDARLVYRIIQQAITEGGTAMNYVSAQKVIRCNGKVAGLAVQNKVNGESLELKTNLVVNATGVWVNTLCDKGIDRLRPLRGSHLIFSQERFPLDYAITLFHPRDQRTVFAIPWEGVTLLGTTDRDHHKGFDESSLSDWELDYLLELCQVQFPRLQLGVEDIISCYSGVRPVIGTGKSDPSKESRDHKIWDEEGLVSITGGKLTLFRQMASDLLKSVRHYFPVQLRQPKQIREPLFPPFNVEQLKDHRLYSEQIMGIISRYGIHSQELLALHAGNDLDSVGDTSISSAELMYSAQSEMVVKLEDLLLRRTRIGILLADGAKAYLKKIRSSCQARLAWSDDKWDTEEKSYLDCYNRYHSAKQAGKA